MPDLHELIRRDSIEAHWFWTTSVSISRYSEYEMFDVTFIRMTDNIVGGGYHERRTFHVQDIGTSVADSRRNNGGNIIVPDQAEPLSQVIADAHIAAQYLTFTEWAEDQRDISLTYRHALTDFQEWETQRARHREIVRWLEGQDSDTYDEYVKAAEQYLADH